MVVQLNIIVLCLPSVNLSFNLVPVVVEYKEVWTNTPSEHRTDLLQRLHHQVSLSYLVCLYLVRSH